MLRESDWRITWDPAGASPRVLLDYADLMEEETARSLEQLVDLGKFDFAASGQVAGRGNVRRRLSFSRRDPHTTGAESWDACQAALAADPWGVKALLQVSPRDGTPRLHAAALLSSTHQPATDGPTPESVHHYAFRIAPQWMLASGSGISVLGGYFNGPNTIIILIPDGEGEDIVPGDTVEVIGVPGVPNGYYPVVSGGGGGGAGGNGLGLGVPAVPGVPPVEHFTMENSLPSSPYLPAGIGPRAYLRREVEFHAATAFEVLLSGSWVAKSPGVHTLPSGLGDFDVPGTWNGLSNVSGPRDIDFAGGFGQVTWRRIGGFTQTIGVPIQGEGTVTYNGSNSGIGGMTLTPLVATLEANGNYIPPDGHIDGGGTVKKVEPTDTEP